MPAKILSVDDSRLIRVIVAGALRPYDCVVREAANGAEGLAAVAGEAPDLIFLDISMPVMDGLEMLAKLKADPVSAGIPVIMLTAWSGQERVVQATALGIRDFLVKPFTKSELVGKVGGVIPLALKPGAPAGACSQPAPSGPPQPVPLRTSQRNKGFGLEVPESVIRLADVVLHQDADVNEIAKIIESDQGLTTRLLRAANARLTDDREKITSISDALTHNGISRVFLLMMGDFVIRAFRKTFQDMLGIQLEVGPAEAADFPAELHILSEVEFSGRCRGRIRLHMEPDTAVLIVSRMLGLDAEEPVGIQRIEETLSELTNIVAGNLLSNLSDARLPSRLSAPRISRSKESRPGPFAGGVSERLVFRAPDITVFLNITIDPWID